jgi:patatin-like phospholipase/acyl hydrolase
VANKTVRILSLDGGGMRGYLSATFLKRFCVQAGIPANQLFNSFDIIAGPQELNAKVMEFETQDLFDDIFNYRFQYQFLPGQDSSLDNYSPEQLTNLASYANQQYDADDLKIQSFIEHFNAG